MDVAQSIRVYMHVLPKCPYRVETQKPGVFFCRHSQVRIAGNLVDAAVCRHCQLHTVSCDEPRPIPDKPIFGKEPTLGRKTWNLVESLTAFVADGLKTVTREEYSQRLQICDTCSERLGNHCVQCGCRLSLKARGRAFRCPLNKWPEILQ